MRKILSVLLVSLLIFSFVSCGSEKNISQGSGEENTETSNILIVYFSRWGNTDYPDDVDATTSASIVPDGDGDMV